MLKLHQLNYFLEKISQPEESICRDKLEEMIQKCGAVCVPCRSSSYSRIVCLTSPEHLRQQLDNLHKEANSTRAKANNARLRLMRLSEAAEKFRRQAAASLRTGKEDDARKLLFQKKKIMQTMETLKNRIELFDELSAKLNEAVSVKEDLLIGNIALDIEANQMEVPSSVRIISPKAENLNKSHKNQQDETDQLKFEVDQEFQMAVESESREDLLMENDLNNMTPSFIPSGWNNLSNSHDLKEISSFEEFMRHIHQQLKQIEEQLETFLSVSTLLLEDKKQPEYLKVQQVTEILNHVHNTRKRITTTVQSKMDTNTNKTLD